jgi:hypothetical protein
MTEPLPHHKCGGNVHIMPQEGGQGTGEQTLYQAHCENCGGIQFYLGSNGRRDSAIRHFNRTQKAKEPDMVRGR